jgi:uncharacterized protein
LLLAGTLVSISAVVLWLLPDGPIEPRWPMTVFGPLLFLTGWLSWKYHQPADQRAVRMAAAIYLFVGLAVTAAGVVQQLAPDPAAVTAATPAPAPKADAGTAASSAKAAAVKPKKTKEERAAEIRAERAKRLQEGATQTADEIRALTKGSYLETVEYRARQFVEKAAGDAGFAVVLVSVFLLGAWFVRSGVMEDTAAHLPFFRKLALIGLPLGIGLGLLTSLIAMSHTPGDRQDGWGIVRGLMLLGNLPASLGYVGLVVTLLHSTGPGSRLRILAPLGRMALTNYLLQSLICAVYFFGFGLGQWGMPRRSRWFSWWSCSPPRSRSATGGCSVSGTARWSGCGEGSPTGRCLLCVRAPARAHRIASRTLTRTAISPAPARSGAPPRPRPWPVNRAAGSTRP